MVFVDNITDLEYYSPNPQWGCYSDAVFAPYDIMLQANGFIVSTTTTAVINVCDPAGTFLEDATAYFDYFLSSFTIAGVTYYFVNIRCDHYSPAMISNRCFVLNVRITDDGTGAVLFNKYTQKYNLINPDVTYATGVIYTTDTKTTELANCLPGANPSNCDTNYIKLSWYFDCVDNFTGDFYQNGTMLNGVGSIPFPFQPRSWIEGKIRQIPKGVKRTVSINCRTQKTETTPKYLATGNVVFPIWKVEEIERMLLAKSMYVNDIEYQSEGGTIFEQFGRPYNCQYAYKLTLPLQKCIKWQIFGCVPNCEALSTYYAFPRAFSRLYDDTETLIATDTTELETYFASRPGVSSVASLPFVLQCPVYALMKVDSSGVLPKYIYVDELAPAARVFPKQLGSNDTTLTPLCNGVTNNNQVPTPDVIGGENEQINVPVPDVVGGQNQPANDYILAIAAADPWILDNNYSSAANYSGEVTLNISASTTDYSSPVANVTLATISGNGIPTVTQVIYGDDNPNLLPGSMLVIDTDGNIKYTGDATNVVGDLIYIEFFMVKYQIQ